MKKIFVIIDETIDESRAIFASFEKSSCEARMKQEFKTLHYVGGDIWRCGSSIISIQEVELE